MTKQEIIANALKNAPKMTRLADAMLAPIRGRMRNPCETCGMFDGKGPCELYRQSIPWNCWRPVGCLLVWDEVAV